MSTTGNMGDAEVSTHCLRWGGRDSPCSRAGYSVQADDGLLLVKELNELTVREREQVYDEVHGVATDIEETPALIEESLMAMRKEIMGLSRRKRKLFERALFLNPSLERDNKFYLMFLRSVNFNAKDAAKKMCKYFEHKVELFGEDKLVKRITLDDLGEKDMELMCKGSVQFLPGTDRSGRKVRVMSIAAYDHKNWQVQMRYSWYQIMSFLENVENQKAGLVDVLHFYGEFKDTIGDMIDFLMKAKHIIHDWPIRVCAFHLCYDSKALRSVLNMLHTLVGTHLRLRERSHFGSRIEAQYALLSFGIQANCFTVGEGILSKEHIEAYVKERKEHEREYDRRKKEAIDKSGVLPYPTSKDVLMGRGRPFRDAAGNLYLSQVVEAYTDRYMQVTDRIEKTMISMQILQDVKQAGGQFVQRTDLGWKAVDDQVAREKISQSLRLGVRQRIAGNQRIHPQQVWEDSDSNLSSEHPEVPDAKRIRL